MTLPEKGRNTYIFCGWCDREEQSLKNQTFKIIKFTEPAVVLNCWKQNNTNQSKLHSFHFLS